jgi:hypothetical protein
MVLPAAADLQYDVSGQDIYRIGQTGIPSTVVYTGSQRLTVERLGDHTTRYDAQARYSRDGDDGKSTANARFVQELMPNGSFEDRINDDPDFLTILNQPFAVQLDPSTMHDLRGLRKAVPFNAGSPLGGDATLHGFLRPGRQGQVAGRPAFAVRFEADGPMTAPMPDRSNATMSGTMRMDGTAYYSLTDAMLLALDATLTIVAQLHDGAQTVPVRIIYKRYIRASSAKTATATAKTPPPTPLATGAVTGSPPKR